MKKSLYFVICFIFMFGFCESVLAEGVNNCPIDIFYKSAVNGNGPVVKEKNTCTSANSRSSSCGGYIKSDAVGVRSLYSTTYSNRHREEEFYCGCYEDKYKKFNVVIVYDDSNSMTAESEGFNGETKNRIFWVKQAIKTIARYFDNDKNKFTVCGFTSDECDYENANYTKLNTLTEIGNKLKTSDFVHNTNLYRGISLARSIVDRTNNSEYDNSYINVVFFITDGYPTVGNKQKFGWLSDSKFAIDSSTGFYYLRNTLSSSNNWNLFNEENAIVYTLGIDVNSSSYFGKFILQPNRSNYNNLVNSRWDSEDNKLGNLIGTGSGKWYHLVAGVSSYPDQGLLSGRLDTAGDYKEGVKLVTAATTSTPAVYRHSVKFGNADSNMQLAPFSGSSLLGEGKSSNSGKIMFGLFSNCDNMKVYTTQKVDGEIKYNNEVSYSKVDVTSTTCAVVIDEKYASRRGYKITWDNTNSSPYSRLVSYDYSFDSSLLDKTLVDYSDLGNSISRMINNISATLDKKLSTICEPDPDDFEKVNVYENKYGNCSNDNVMNFSINELGGLYHKEIGGTCSKVTSLNVPVVIRDNMEFSAGDLANSQITYAGGGFKLDNISVTNKIKWAYSNYADYNKLEPIVNVNGKNRKRSDLFYNSSCAGSAVTIDNLDEIVWKKIKNSKIVDNQSEVESKFFSDNNYAFTSIDSNEKNDFTKFNAKVPMNVSIESDNTDVVYNFDRSDSKVKVFTIKYNFQVKRAIYNYEDSKFEYVDSDECLNNSSCIEDDRKYYVPFEMPKSDQIKFNINGYFHAIKNYNIKYSDVCEGNVDVGTESYYKGYSYRSIDLGDPFPKSNNEYSKIPLNWRGWYCTNVGGIGCNVNLSNSNRLVNSYNSSNLLYKINLDSSNLSAIVNDTSSGNYYTSFKNISNDGISSFVDSKFNINNSANSYCELGKFDEKCDQHG